MACVSIEAMRLWVRSPGACTARGCAARPWRRSAWVCITGCATFSAVPLGLPHAQTHAVLLPYVAAYIEPRTDSLKPLGKFFDGDTLAVGLRRLAVDLGAHRQASRVWGCPKRHLIAPSTSRWPGLLMARGCRRSLNSWRSYAERGMGLSTVSESLKQLRVEDGQGIPQRLQRLASLLTDATATGQLCIGGDAGNHAAIHGRNDRPPARARCGRGWRSVRHRPLLLGEVARDSAHVLTDRTPAAGHAARGPLSGVAFVAKNAIRCQRLAPPMRAARIRRRD